MLVRRPSLPNGETLHTFQARSLHDLDISEARREPLIHLECGTNAVGSRNFQNKFKIEQVG